MAKLGWGALSFLTQGPPPTSQCPESTDPMVLGSCSKIQTYGLSPGNSHWGWCLPAMAKEIQMIQLELENYPSESCSFWKYAPQQSHKLGVSPCPTHCHCADQSQSPSQQSRNPSSTKKHRWGWVSWSLYWCGSCCKSLMRVDSSGLILACLLIHAHYPCSRTVAWH